MLRDEAAITVSGAGHRSSACEATGARPGLRSTCACHHGRAARRPKGLAEMTTYQHAAPAPARSGGTDVAAWAIVALVVAVICAGAGWAIARQDNPGEGDLQHSAQLASRDGFVRGEREGYGEGARLGRRQVALRTRTQMAAERRQAAREGYDTGFAEGRAKAGDPDAFMYSSAGAGAYPSAGYEDILAADLFGGDAPGYSDSAYDSLGYGTGVTSPYLGTSAALGTSLGDDSLY
jgi:hypothetical protein